MRENNNLSVLVRNNSDKIKAILIIIVAADHNDWLRQFSHRLFDPLTFHVLGFLLLSFSFGTKTWSRRFVLDRIARYLIPFWWFLTATSLAFALLYSPDKKLSDYFANFFLAAAIGNAPFVKTSSGLMMLWFLPCLFGLNIILALFDSTNSDHIRSLNIGLAITAHLFLPLIPKGPLLWIPCGLAITIDIFIIGIVWRKLLPRRLPELWGPASLLVFFTSYATLVAVPVNIELATLDLFGIADPVVFFLQDISGISGFLSVIWFASMLNDAERLERVGRNSLLIYLLHPFVYVFIGKIWPSAASATLTPMALLTNGVITTFLAVCLAYAIAAYVSRTRFLSDWITPRLMQQWPPAKPFFRHSHPK